MIKIERRSGSLTGMKIVEIDEAERIQ